MFCFFLYRMTQGLDTSPELSLYVASALARSAIEAIAGAAMANDFETRLTVLSDIEWTKPSGGLS